MNEPLLFISRAEFRDWLSDNYLSMDGFQLLFGKAGGPETLKAGEALEEAFCFGWIDGQMQSLDDKTYRECFSQRRRNSKWSEKNKTLMRQLEQKRLVTDYGRQKIEETKEDGQQNAPKPTTVTGEQITALTELSQNHEPARTNFLSIPPSVKKTYTHAYYDAKTESGRGKHLTWMVKRLNKNLKPM